MSYSFFGLIVALNGSYLTVQSEEDAIEEEEVQHEESFSSLNRSQNNPERSEFCKKLSKNMREIGKAILMPEIYFVIIFFILNGVLSPDFGDFSYYFMLNVVKLSKF